MTVGVALSTGAKLPANMAGIIISCQLNRNEGSEMLRCEVDSPKYNA